MKQKELLSKVFGYIDRRIEEKITAAELCGEFHYSVWHFCRLFSEFTGMSPTRYITLRKLQFALFDLAGGMKVLDVAVKYGFDTSDGFVKAFKSAYGSAPTKYPFAQTPEKPARMDFEQFETTFGGNIMTSIPIQKGALHTIFTVTERGVRKKTKHKLPTHSMGFPALMSALITFLGLNPRMELFEREPFGAYLRDADYYFQLAVSTEGFGLFYDLPQAVIACNYWNGEPLRDCFNAEGIRYRLLGDEEIATAKDGAIDPETIFVVIREHLKKDLPVILFYHANLMLLVTGFCESSGDMLGFPFADGSANNKAFELQKNSRLYQNWANNLGAVILVDGLGEHAERGEIIKKALLRGVEMLTETKPMFYDYGFGDKLYENWIGYLQNDGNFKSKKDSHRFISPEEVDMAERRAFTSEFFYEAEEYLGKDKLKEARDAFCQIHGNMMKIQKLTSFENEGKLLERQTREQIVEILKECNALDRQAAECIKSALNG